MTNPYNALREPQSPLICPAWDPTHVSCLFSFYFLLLLFYFNFNFLEPPLFSTLISPGKCMSSIKFHKIQLFYIFADLFQEPSTIPTAQLVIPAASCPSSLATSYSSLPATSCPSSPAASYSSFPAASYPSFPVASCPSLPAASCPSPAAASSSLPTTLSCPSLPAASCLSLPTFQVDRPPARPNTTLQYMLFTPYSSKMPAG